MHLLIWVIKTKEKETKNLRRERKRERMNSAIDLLKFINFHVCVCVCMSLLAFSTYTLCTTSIQGTRDPEEDVRSPVTRNRDDCELLCEG